MQPSMAEQWLYNTTQQNQMSREKGEIAGKGQLSAFHQVCQEGHASLFPETYPEEFWHIVASKSPTTFERHISETRLVLNSMLLVS